MERIDRRCFIAAVAGAGASAALLPSLAWAADEPFLMWQSPACGCCTEWARRVEAAFGRPLAVVKVDDIGAIKRARGIPQDLLSCHSASIGGYVIEGHVPPADIKRLIASGDRSIKGLAVPGMPMGAPGMDGHGHGHGHSEKYDVVAFKADGTRSVFASHG